MKFGNEKYIITPKQLICLIAVLVCLLTAWGVTAFLETVSGLYAPFHKTYTGIEWYLNESNAESVSLEFEGVKNFQGEFIGDITITKGEEVLHAWDDCKAYSNGGNEFFICPQSDEAEDDKGDTIRLMMQCHAVLYTDAWWSEFTIHLSAENEDGMIQLNSNYTMFTSAETLEEARRITAELTEKVSFYLFYEKLRK